MRRSFAIALASTLVGALLVGAIFSLQSDSVANADRITAAERGFCKRLQRERDARNRDSAIIFVVLQQVASNSRQLGRGANGREYDQLSRLTEYQPPTDCRRAIADPVHYQPPDRVPFANVDGPTLAKVLGVPVALLLAAFGVDER